MKRNFYLAGLAGLGIGLSIFVGASALSTRLPILAEGFLSAVIIFSILLLISLAEIPLMLLGIRQIVRSPTAPGLVVVGAFAIFVMFASVYASIFVLLTGQIIWGSVLVALCVVRLLAGIFAK